MSSSFLGSSSSLLFVFVLLFLAVWGLILPLSCICFSVGYSLKRADEIAVSKGFSLADARSILIFVF